jgi:hypothetical protein
MYAVVRYKIDDADSSPDLDVLSVTMDEKEAIDELSTQVFREFGYSTEMEELAEGKYNWDMPPERDDFLVYFIHVCEI